MKISFTPSLIAQTQLQRSSKAISRSLERLSTGQRVNRAADDSVTLAHDTTLSAQIRGLRQGAKNVNTALGMLSTAEGAITTQLDIVARMRELALQASNGTLTSADRTNINQEINQLFQEFQRISTQTEFNGQKLLDGSLGKVGLQVGSKRESGMDQIFMSLSDLSAAKVFQKTVGVGSFNARVTYQTTGSASVSVGDVNGDGNVDVVTSDTSAGTISVFLSNGDGTFQNPQIIQESSAFDPFDLRLADLNQDGILDITVLNISSGTLGVMIGNGDGTFRSAGSYEGTSYGDPSSPTYDVGDINKDGILDLLTISSNGTEIFYYLGQGDGTFGAQGTYYQSVDTLQSFRLADLNHDGVVDLVARTFGGTNDVYLGNGNSGVNSTLTYSIGYNTGSFADVNNDGKLDWIDMTDVYLGNGNGTFQSASSLASETGIQWAIGDINNDGNLDLVDQSSGAMLFGRGDGTFVTSSTIPIHGGGGVTGGALADLNGDGVLDYLSVESSGGVNNGFSVNLANPIQTSAITDINVSTSSSAQALLKILDTAADALRAEQARIGALHSRLDFAASANLLQADNLDEARQNAMAVDLTLETAELVRQQILQNAQVSVLAQANLQMKVVLELLKPLHSMTRLTSY